MQKGAPCGAPPHCQLNRRYWTVWVWSDVTAFA